MSKLKQLLFSLNETDRKVIEEKLKTQDQQIDQLKQQLAEKDKEIKSLIVDYEKRISQEQELMSNMEHRLAEKQNMIDEINKEFVKAVHDWKALLKAKDKFIEQKLLNIYKLLKTKVLNFSGVEAVRVYEINKIFCEELASLTEQFECEICGEATPKNCEGGEPNVCADCVPTKTHDLSTEIEPYGHENDFLD